MQVAIELFYLQVQGAAVVVVMHRVNQHLQLYRLVVLSGGVVTTPYQLIAQFGMPRIRFLFLIAVTGITLTLQYIQIALIGLQDMTERLTE